MKETVEDKVKLHPAKTDFMWKFNPAGAETVGWGRGGEAIKQTKNILSHPYFQPANEPASTARQTPRFRVREGALLR